MEAEFNHLITRPGSASATSCYAEVPQETTVRKIKRHLGQVFHDLARRKECGSRKDI